MDEPDDGSPGSAAAAKYAPWGVFVFVAGACIVTLAAFLTNWWIAALGVAVGCGGGALLAVAAFREGSRGR